LTFVELEELVWGGERGRLAQVGQIPETEQWLYVCQQVGWPEDRAQEMKEIFFAGDRVDRELADRIRSLRQRFLTGVISNAMDGARHFLCEEAGIGDAFDNLTYSYEVGFMKPDERIFRAALNSLQVKAEESVFIDDFEHNVLGARQVGMQAIHFHYPDQVLLDLGRLLDES
jgi:HAD superfamily hydrolase (TIGR01509 family)